MLTTNMARGGAETVVARLAVQLKRRGHETNVISLLPPTAFESELREAGVPLLAPGLSRVAGVLRRLRPEVLHCHMFHANVCGRMLHLILPVPAVISTLHSAVESKRSSGKFRRRDLLYRVTDRLADATVAVSQAVAERHFEAKAVREPLVIPNGIDTSEFRPDPERRQQTRAELGLGSEFVWLAVGRLMWKKNFGLLLRAFPHSPQTVLLLAGAGPEESSLRAIAGPNVRFLGERRDVAALMNAADGFVLSSVVEGLPLALLEAGASGLPSVATDAGGVRETGLALVTEPEALGDRLQQVMSMNAQEREETGRAVRLLVEKGYSHGVVTEQWESLYRTLTASM
jgi:glycosyltransferase involved in cell wall biosynthesis